MILFQFIKRQGCSGAAVLESEYSCACYIEKNLGISYSSSSLDQNIVANTLNLVPGLVNYTFPSPISVPKGYMVNTWYNGPSDTGRIAYDSSGTAPYSDIIIDISAEPVYKDFNISNTGTKWRFYTRVLVDSYTVSTSTPGKTSVDLFLGFKRRLKEFCLNV